MSNASVGETIQSHTFAMLKDAPMQARSFTAWNAPPKTTNTIITSLLKLKLNYKKEYKIGKTLSKIAKNL
jgi:hypothetical protein